MEITHQYDPDRRAMRQIVSPARLRAVLAAAGEDEDRPADFGPDDAWIVGPATDTSGET